MMVNPCSSSGCYAWKGLERQWLLGLLYARAFLIDSNYCWLFRDSKSPCKSGLSRLHQWQAPYTYECNTGEFKSNTLLLRIIISNKNMEPPSFPCLLGCICMSLIFLRFHDHQTDLLWLVLYAIFYPHYKSSHINHWMSFHIISARPVHKMKHISSAELRELLNWCNLNPEVSLTRSSSQSLMFFWFTWHHVLVTLCCANSAVEEVLCAKWTTMYCIKMCRSVFQVQLCSFFLFFE